MMKRLLLIGTVIVLAIVALGVVYILRPPAEATEPIQAIALVAEQEAEISEETAAVSDTNTQDTNTQDTNTQNTNTQDTNTQDTSTENDSLLILEIGQDNSQVSFDLDEDLRGVRTTVLGVTDQVAGQIALNPADLSTVQVGTIQVNARTLATDNEFRNRAIQNEILDTGSYEYITFTPTAVEGLPDSVAVNESVAFTIAGDLTIRDVTQEAIFEVTATMVSETELSGTASATVSWQDYGLSIPSVPHVANVDEEVALVIEFMASA